PNRFIYPAGTAGIAGLPEPLAALGKSLLAALGLLGRVVPGRGSSRACRPARCLAAPFVAGRIRPRWTGGPGRRRFGASRVFAGRARGPGTHRRVVTDGRRGGGVAGFLLGRMPIPTARPLPTGSTYAAVPEGFARAGAGVSVARVCGARICSARLCAGCGAQPLVCWLGGAGLDGGKFGRLGGEPVEFGGGVLPRGVLPRLGHRGLEQI